jgi:1-phosphofructokinase family hexose kinase
MALGKVKFLCVCLSPAVDATVQIDEWPSEGCVIKNAKERFTPGGKGLNVARHLASRGADVACAGILGKDNSSLFESELSKYGIRDLFTRVSGATRLNEMFISPNGSFKVNRPSQSGNLKGIEDFDLSFFGFDIVIFSGSLPSSWSSDSYFKLVTKGKDAGLEVVLDTSGDALREGIKAHPNIIKPNREECEDIVGFPLKTPDDFLKATSILREFTSFPIISDGEKGCWFDGEFVEAPKIEAYDTTGAGDTLLAEWCYQRYECRENKATAAIAAVAASSEVCKKRN